jgi:hypothetical protein
MPRAVDPKRTRKALKAVRKTAQAAPALSDWEQTFLAEVEGRLETYGSAFANLSKGAPEEALSRLQHVKLRELAAKARKEARAAARGLPAPEPGLKRGGGFKRKQKPPKD